VVGLQNRCVSLALPETRRETRWAIAKPIKQIDRKLGPSQALPVGDVKKALEEKTKKHVKKIKPVDDLDYLQIGQYYDISTVGLIHADPNMEYDQCISNYFFFLSLYACGAFFSTAFLSKPSQPPAWCTNLCRWPVYSWVQEDLYLVNIMESLHCVGKCDANNRKYSSSLEIGEACQRVGSYKRRNILMEY